MTDNAALWKSGIVSKAIWLQMAFAGAMVFGVPLACGGTQEKDTATNPFFSRYCVECHQGDDAEGDFFVEEFLADFETGPEDESLESRERIARVLLDSRMPPEDSLQPSQKEVANVIDWLAIDSLPEATMPMVRRMNRSEYENTIRSLFQLPRDGFDNPDKIVRLDEYFDPATRKMPRHVFAISCYSVAQYTRADLLEVSVPPADLPALHGFNNDAAVLSISPLLVEKYLQLSREIVNSPTLPAISGLWPELFRMDKDACENDKQVGREARTRLSSFLREAFRRPVTEQEVNQFGNIFDELYRESHSFVDAMKETVSTVLISPEFLFLFQQPAGDLSATQRRSIVNASRLSYFLWAAPPDDQLLELAGLGRLVTEAQIRKQAKRMLLDKRVKSLATNFGMQWLKVNRLASSQPDIEKFPSFYARQKQPIGIAMMIEQLLLFETIMVEDRSILEFIDTDFAYLNIDLMKWYGLDPKEVVGASLSKSMQSDFFRIKIPRDKGRGGAITAGATLVLTSTSTRSSPVFRGLWVVETIFNQPVPPPPADVPALEEIADDSGGKTVTVREKLALHRDYPQCSSCHDRIDPLGFGLEQFDAVGKFRSKYEKGQPVDSTGEIRGVKFDQVGEYKNAVLQNKALFARGFASHLLRYAINRELTVADEKDIQSIADAIIENDYSFHSAVMAVIASPLFSGLPMTTERAE